MTPKESLTITTIRNPNTHDFYEYITEPKVARALLSIVYDKSVTDSQFSKGKKDYDSGSLGTKAKELRDLINDVRANPSVSTIDKAIKKFKQIQAKIEKLKKNV